MWLQRIDEYDLVPRLARALNLSSGERKAMLSEQEITVLRGDLITFLSKHWQAWDLPHRADCAGSAFGA